MKAIRANIYKHKGQTCSNHGISERFNEVLIINEEGWIEVDGTEENLCEVRCITFGGRTHYYIQPVAKPQGLGWMAGGCIVYTCDSRFPFDYPLSLHDRQESQKEYDMYSH